ncbi:hypothetical protein [Paenibacillus sp. GYB003]|uniref:hypothetical protein n=1 Tax=Paenibacillus sp. GYB003 TaxID=2994392 RepID=UPI002F962393
MSKVLRGTYTEGLGYKKVRKPAQTYWSEIINAKVTYDPPSVAAAAGVVSTALTVTGADIGDRVNVFPPYSTQGIIVSGYVDAADTVKLSLFNPTAAAIDLASGTWQIQVVKP